MKLEINWTNVFTIIGAGYCAYYENLLAMFLFLGSCLILFLSLAYRKERKNNDN